MIMWKNLGIKLCINAVFTGIVSFGNVVSTYYNHLKFAWQNKSVLVAYCEDKIKTRFQERVVVKDSTYYLKYKEGPHDYTIAFKKNRHPFPFCEILDCEGNDVMHKIRGYMGISKNFHGIPTTPKMLGFTQLTFHTRKGDIHTYSEDDIINL